MRPILYPPTESQNAKLFRRATSRRTRLDGAARDAWVRRGVDYRGVEYGVNRAGMVVCIPPRLYYGKSQRRRHIAIRRAQRHGIIIEEAK